MSVASVRRDFSNEVENEQVVRAKKTPTGVEPIEGGFAGRCHSVWSPASLMLGGAWCG